MNHNALIILDDDQVFADTLARRLSKKSFQTLAYYDVESLLDESGNCAYLILDLNLGSHSIIPHLPVLRQKWPQAKIIMLTGYASIASTVSAMKKGADDYLTKPINFEQLLNCLRGKAQNEQQDLSVLSSAQLEWEHIQRVLQEHDGNVSATARALNMHRRTLQRKLQKKTAW